MRVSLAIHRQHLAADDPRLAIVLGLKAQIESGLGRTREAIASAREALAIAEQSHAADSVEAVAPLSTLGEVYLMAGDFDAALPLLQRAVELARVHDRVQLEFNTARSLALLEMYREQPRAALPWLEMASAAAQRRTGGKGVLPLTIAGMHWWARGLAGELDAARAGIAGLREPIIAISGAESVDEMVRRHYAGELAHRAGDHAAAIVELREALRIGGAVPELAQSSFVHQSAIVLGASLLALAPEDAEGRRLIEAGIAGLNAKDMGWHPWVRRGQGLLPGAG
jgi:tetratricopeptide (TPR) repeat protein